MIFQTIFYLLLYVFVNPILLQKKMMVWYTNINYKLNLYFMTLAQVLKQKKELSLKLKKGFKLPIKNKALGLIQINNKTLLKKLYFWLANLPVDFVVVWDFDKEWIDEQFKNIYITKKVNKANLQAYDFTVIDSEVWKLWEYFENAVVPISPNDNHFSSILKEYQPMKNEGNAYLYDESNEWSIFYAISRYLENYKISFDNKNLVKNVYEA